MQNVSFNNLNDFFDFLPEHELKIVEALRSLIFECIPNCKERLSFNVPFYSRHYGVCFIWPGSITWGKVQTEVVRFGFMRGNLLNDESNYLDKGNRKQVYYKDFKTLKDIDFDLLRSYLFEAVECDDELHRNKQLSKKRSKRK
jgi:hypothetical protein